MVELLEKTPVLYSKKKGIFKNLLEFTIINLPILIAAIITSVIIHIYAESSIVTIFLTFLFVSSWSYFSHIILHTPLFYIIGQIHSFHHNDAYADSYFFFFVELLLNFFIVGGFLFIPFMFFIENRLGFSIVDHYIILIWSLYFTSYHLINYHYYDKDIHKEHHVSNGQNNYGPEWMDILFDTKKDESPLQNFNSGIINLFIITTLVLWFVPMSRDNLP
jgi:hypothetical protein